MVTSGLQNGDQVVLSGVHVLTAGQKVSIFGKRVAHTSDKFQYSEIDHQTAQPQKALLGN